jgi:hypothetical protein
VLRAVYENSLKEYLYDMDMRSKQYSESSKAKEVKKCETSEQRCHKYTRFLKTAGVATLLATAGMVEGRVMEPENMRSLAQRNTTRPEFNPGPITPEFIDHLKKVGASEKLIQKVEREEQLAQQNPGRRLQAIPGSDPICLDVSNSQAQTNIEPVNPQDTPVPGTEERVDFFLNVKNNCPVAVDAVDYVVQMTITCPDGASPPTDTRAIEIGADPSTVGVGENSGMVGPQSFIGRCVTYDASNTPTAINPPTGLTATVYAVGTQQNILSSVYSQTFEII